jgi:hypothetical protein
MVYNGSVSSLGIPLVGTLVAGDIIGTAPIQVYDNKNFGTTHTLIASGLTIKDGSSADMTGNYLITYTTSPATGIITKLPVTVTAVASTKIYDGTDASLGVPTVGTLAPGDVVNSAPIQVYDNKNSGTAHTLTASGLTIEDGSNADMTGNYAITYSASPATGIIIAKEIVITPDPGQNKTQGDPDPVFTYTFAPALFVPDVISGALGRDPGETPGTYPFTLGNLSAGSNYSLIMTASPSDFTIIIATGLDELKEKSSLSLRNFPNPFQTNTTISYTLPSDGRVTLIIRDITGQLVKTLVNDEFKAKGDYTISVEDWVPEPGVYMATLKLRSNVTELLYTIKMLKSQ